APTLRRSFLFFSCYGDHPDLHSFPTRRSSDLEPLVADRQAIAEAPSQRVVMNDIAVPNAPGVVHQRLQRLIVFVAPITALLPYRSEEHSSELQSRENLVCRLLLEKKKTQRKNI